MYTLNNQQYSSAFANMYHFSMRTGSNLRQQQRQSNVAVQPFIESALGGASSAYCAGYSSCTQALIANNKSLISGGQVSDLWLAMSKVPSWTLGSHDDQLPAELRGGGGQHTGSGLLAATAMATTTPCSLLTG